MPFDGKPFAGQDDDADEFARLFGAPEQSTSARAPFRSTETPAAQPRAVDAAGSSSGSAASSPPGEFTQIFRQIAKPVSQPPDLGAPLATPSPQSSGEFTQIFSSPVSAPAAPPAGLPVVQSFSSSPPRPSHAGGPESLTQIFQQMDSGPRGASPAPSPTRSGTPFGPPATDSSLPFADPSAGRSFQQGKDPFAAFAEPGAAAPLSSSASPNGTSTSALTQLFQALEPERPRPAAATVMPAAAPDRLAAAPITPLAPSMPPASRAPGLQGGPGEFTRLMESLGSSPGQAPSPHAVPAAALPVASAVAGESEFTRVMRGSAVRGSGASATPLASAVAPAATAAKAPSLAPAAEPAKEKPKSEAAAKPKPWLLVLLVVNGILLLLLVVVAFLFLQRHH